MSEEENLVLLAADADDALESGDTNSICIEGTDLCVQLGGQQVLRGLNIQIPSGVVYTLLGPSGCGKTTLMKTLLGLYVPNEGHVYLMNHTPRSSPLAGKIGYVPQSLGLHKKLRVGEHLAMYARISGLSSDQINEKIQEYHKRFRLPALDQVIHQLSFGQQKLVSVCAALICDPWVAILDEPTVGLDPYRRRQLWDYFEQMAATGRTIFVTTHHVNEANRANLVAIMYQGKLMIQDTPAEVIRKMEVNSLEEAYLKVYRGNVGNMKNQSVTVTRTKHVKQKAAPVFTFARLWRTLLTLAVVSQMFYRTIFRNFWGDLIAFGMVTTQFVLITHCIGPKPFDLPIHIVNDDEGTDDGSYMLGNQMTNILSNDPDKEIIWFVDPPGTRLEDAIELVKLEQSFGVLYIQKNFSAVVKANGNNRQTPFAFSLHVDATDSAIRNQLISQVYGGYLSLLFDNGFDNKIQDIEHVVKNVRGPSNSMTNFFLTALFVAVTVVAGMMSAGTAFMREKEDEALDRLQAMGVAGWMIFTSELLPWVPWVVGDFPVRMFVALKMMDGPFEGRYLPLVVLNVMGFSLGNSIGILLAVFATSTKELMQVIVPIFSLLYLPSGCMWPESSLPDVILPINNLNPIKWLVAAFRAVYLRDLPTTKAPVSVALVYVPCLMAFLLFVAGLSMESHTPMMVRFRIWLKNCRQRK